MMSGPERPSNDIFSRAYRKALWSTLAISCALVLIVLVVIVTEENTAKNHNADEAIVCNKYAAVDGSDDADGTRAAPFHTVQRLVDSLSAGQVGCLHGGVYTEADKRMIFNIGGDREGRVVLRSYPGETAEFRGLIYIPEGRDYITIRDMRIDGSYGDVGKGHLKGDHNTTQAVRVLGDDVNILDNNITNRRTNGDPDLAGSCILLGSSESSVANTIIEGNRIHDCGQMPRTNHEHGIYASATSGAKIIDNLLYDNADRGIQLYPDARGTLVAGNVVDGNGQGLVINADSSYNVVRNNVFSYPDDTWNVNVGPVSSGKGNRVSDNCFWAPADKSKFHNGSDNTIVRGNITADPHYRHSFEITNPTCLDKYSGTLAR